MRTNATPKGNGKEQQVGPPAPPSGTGAVGDIPDERINDCVPDLTDKQGSSGNTGAYLHFHRSWKFISQKEVSVKKMLLLNSPTPKPNFGFLLKFCCSMDAPMQRNMRS